MATSRSLLRLALRASASALLLAAAASCGPLHPCDGVSGSCLSLRVDGTGPFDAIQGALVGASGDLRAGALTMVPTALPFTIRMIPPAGVSSSQVKSIRVEGVRNAVISASGTTSSGFSWPDGAHIETTIQLGAVEPPPPGPLIVWRQEATPSGANSPLYDVWAKSMGSGGDFVVAVGADGVTLTKSGTSWVSELSNTNALLGGVYGESSGAVFAVGQMPTPGVYKRDAVTPTWTKETGSMPGGKGFWSVTAGTAAGELWAGDDDGKVWHRTLNGMGMPVWASEQVLPVGIGVYGVAQAGGAIFAVGDSAYVAYRKDSGATTTWAQSRVTNGLTTNDWLQGLWAFDANTAVAVGTSGSLVRFQGGTWSQNAIKIDTNNTELFGVWGMTASKVWVVGRSGQILRVDNNTVYKLYSKPGIDLFSIFGLSETNLYAVGGTASAPSFLLHGTL